MQYGAIDVLHHQEVDVVRAADVVDRADVGMIQRCDGSRFALEPLAGPRVAGVQRGKNLDGDRAVEPRVAGLVDVAHPAGAEAGYQLVGPQACAFQMWPGQGLDDRRRPVEKAIRLIVCREQVLDTTSELPIRAARRHDVRTARLGRQRQRRLEDRPDPGPTAWRGLHNEEAEASL